MIEDNDTDQGEQAAPTISRRRAPRREPKGVSRDAVLRRLFREHSGRGVKGEFDPDFIAYCTPGVCHDDLLRLCADLLSAGLEPAHGGHGGHPRNVIRAPGEAGSEFKGQTRPRIRSVLARAMREIRQADAIIAGDA